MLNSKINPLERAQLSAAIYYWRFCPTSHNPQKTSPPASRNRALYLFILLNIIVYFHLVNGHEPNELSCGSWFSVH